VICDVKNRLGKAKANALPLDYALRAALGVTGQFGELVTW
jgi:hypothetical protein